jgi:vacuolar protein sorting-associated protein 13D
MKPNVFTQILEPVTKARREGSLQAEVHYRSTEEFTRFTVVLNNMRLLAVFDWWALFQEFLLQNPEEYRGTTKGERYALYLSKNIARLIIFVICLGGIRKKMMFSKLHLDGFQLRSPVLLSFQQE